jgi:hypothetical protein
MYIFYIPFHIRLSPFKLCFCFEGRSNHSMQDRFNLLYSLKYRSNSWFKPLYLISQAVKWCSAATRWRGFNEIGFCKAKCCVQSQLRTTNSHLSSIVRHIRRGVHRSIDQTVYWEIYSCCQCLWECLIYSDTSNTKRRLLALQSDTHFETNIEPINTFNLITKYYSVDQIKENEVGGTCSTYGWGERWIQNFGGETWGKETTWKAQV